MFKSVEFMLDGTPEQKNTKQTKPQIISHSIMYRQPMNWMKIPHTALARDKNSSFPQQRGGCGFRVMLHSMLATSMIHIRGSMLGIDCEAIQCFGDVPLASAPVETPGCVIRRSRRDLPATMSCQPASIAPGCAWCGGVHMRTGDDTIATPTWILCCTSRSDTLARLRMSDSGHPPEKVPRAAPLQVACKLCTFI
jgi:hypothetical protein